MYFLRLKYLKSNQPPLLFQLKKRRDAYISEINKRGKESQSSIIWYFIVDSQTNCVHSGFKENTSPISITF